MAGANVISASFVRPARGVTAQPAGSRPVIEAIAVPGEQGPDNTDYVTAQIAALLNQLDPLLLPNFNFSRLSLAGTLPYVHRI
jgi:hypothetical protein